MISNPNIGFLVVAVILLSGLVFYYPFVYRKIELGFIRKFIVSLKHGRYNSPVNFLEQINTFLKRIIQLEKCDININ